MVTRRQALVAVGASAGIVASYRPARAAASRPTVALTLPLTGVQATVAKELQLGYAAALSDSADLLVLDDESKAEKTAANMTAFGADSRVIASTGIVGTPHAKAALPIAIAAQLPLVGIRSGAGELRDANPWVFHLRASYEQEIEKVLETAAVFGNLGVMYSEDDFGRGALAHAEKVAAAKGVKIAAKFGVERNGSNVKAQADALARAALGGSVGATLLCLIQTPALAATKELRGTHRLVIPIFGMSFIATSTLATSRDPAFEGLALVSPFLLARISVAEMARSFRDRMVAAKTEHLIASPTAFEGYFYGSVLADAIERGGPSRKAVQSYLLQQRAIEVKQIPIRFDERRVGYHYLALLRKTGSMLRA
ncbi:ABC transporter substrate-binding protein [Ramlibacter sp. AN1133]|uniref:ABC transporter substrate-binding protein n=1 Tax=Ramlibacter sp. AN1133 TaxID=3133429 RepID=UPI0030C5B1A0